MRFLQQFNQPLLYILLLLAVTALQEWSSLVIFGVTLLNAIIGLCRNQKPRAITALPSLSPRKQQSSVTVKVSIPPKMPDLGCWPLDRCLLITAGQNPQPASR